MVFGDAGNDWLVGDGGSNTLPFDTDLPQVVSGIRLSGIAEGADVPLLLDAGGAVIVPALTVLPEALTSRAPVLTQVPETVDAFERWAHDDGLRRVDGAAMSAYVALVPDVIHSLEALPGNDWIDGGVGDDFIVGDDLLAYSPLFPGLAEIDAALAGLGEWTTKLQHLLHHLSIDFDLAEQTIGAGLANAQQELNVANDDLYGGSGADTIVGDNALLVSAYLSGLAVASSDVLSAALDYYNFVRDVEHLLADLSFVTHEAYLGVIERLIDEAIQETTVSKQTGRLQR